jgi:glycolate oxidase
MLSSVCEPGLEDLAKVAPAALRLYQLYVRGDAAWVDDHVGRALDHG